MPQCTLVVRRRAADDIKIRDLLVQVDKLPEFNIGYGHQRDVPLDPGDHTLSATNRLYRQSKTFSLEPGQIATFEVANYSKGCLAGFFMGMGMGLYRVRIEETGSDEAHELSLHDPSA